jgi:NifB/MoaA-like Fe-S oxidoreductase
MLRSFNEDFEAGFNDTVTSDEPRRVSVATGVAAYPMIADMATRAEKKRVGMSIKVYKIKNKFFGEAITVAGLLTGRDIYEQLRGESLGDVLYIPRNALRAGEETFLCGMTVSELAEKLGVEVIPVTSDGYELALTLLED